MIWNRRRIDVGRREENRREGVTGQGMKEVKE